MIASRNEKRINLQMQSALVLNKKLRRLTTTKVLTFYSRIFKICAESFKTVGKNVHKTAKKTPFSSRVRLYLVLS